MKDSDFYCPNKMLSYDEYLNFILGARSAGKTFALKKRGLVNFIKNDMQFIYLRRNKTELDRLDKEGFFTKELMSQVFKNYEITSSVTNGRETRIEFTCDNFKKGDINVMKINSTKVTLNDKIVCYMKSLSTWVDLKGSEYDSVNMIIFDEVLIDMTSRKQYLPTEVKALFNFIFSVFRLRKNCHIYLLSNSANYNNPYFNYWNFQGDNTKRFHHLKNERVLIEFAPNKPIGTKIAEDNPFFQLISKSDDFDNIVNNEFQEKLDNNIGKVKGFKQRLYSLYCDGTFLTIYGMDEFIYINRGYDKNLRAYTLNIKDVDNGFVFLPRTDSICRHIRRHFYENRLCYEDFETKTKFTNAIQKII